jgi:hypothetical protein
MTTQANYTPEEWNILVHAPVQASVLVMKADPGSGISGRLGAIQETKDAQHVIEETAKTATTPLVKDVAQSLTGEQSWSRVLQRETPESITKTLQAVPAILASKAGKDEVVEYNQYVLAVAKKTASSVHETGEKHTSPKEAIALQQIEGLLKVNG